jgi:hypothetical protein
MTEQYIGWAFAVGLAVGGALVWFAWGRLPPSNEDRTPAEREAEAAWISRMIEEQGAYAPPDVVLDVLELHAEYVDGEMAG